MLKRSESANPGLTARGPRQAPPDLRRGRALTPRDPRPDQARTESPPPAASRGAPERIEPQKGAPHLFEARRPRSLPAPKRSRAQEVRERVGVRRSNQRISKSFGEGIPRRNGSGPWWAAAGSSSAVKNKGARRPA